MKRRCGAPTLMGPSGRIILRTCRNFVRKAGYCWLHGGTSGRGIGVARAKP